MKFVFVCMVAVLPFFVACGSDVPTAAQSRDTENVVGILTGKVVIGPNCPVEHQGQTCPPPASVWQTHVVVITDTTGRTVAQLTADSSGEFRTELAPGTYVVDFQPHDIGIGGRSFAQTVAIQANQTTSVVINIDTGIR